MSNSTEWHKHKDGEWHRHHKAFYSTCDTTGFYDTTLGEPFKEEGKPKYIQDTDWWKEVDRKAGEELQQECQEAMDKVIIEALGAKEESMLKVEAGGRGSRGGRLL